MANNPLFFFVVIYKNNTGRRLLNTVTISWWQPVFAAQRMRGAVRVNQI